jgi:hypothetical protein
MKLSELIAGDRLVNRLTVPICMSSDALNDFAVARVAVDEARKKLERAQRVEEGRMAAPMTTEARGELEQAEGEAGGCGGGRRRTSGRLPVRVDRGGRLG